MNYQAVALAVLPGEWATSHQVASRVNREVGATGTQLNAAYSKRLLERQPDPSRPWAWLYARPGTAR